MADMGTKERSQTIFELSKDYLRDATVFRGRTHPANFFIHPQALLSLSLSLRPLQLPAASSSQVNVVRDVFVRYHSRSRCIRSDPDGSYGDGCPPRRTSCRGETQVKGAEW